jgi:4-amino-4-deoxy-L-arabinose transferase-like glycosyltransferase
MPHARALRAAVLAAAAALFLTRLGAVDLWAPDEPRYAQVAEEVRSFQHGWRGLWLMHLNGEAYTQKPPLYFWLAALAGAPAAHVSEAAARLPSALSGVACVALLIALGSRMRGPAVGIAAGALLATCASFAHLARRVQLDVLLSACELAALALFWRIDRAAAPRARDVAALHAALGLAVLTKGPVGFIAPLLAIAAFLAWERRLGALRRCFPWWSPLLSIAPGLVWVAGAALLAPPGFAHAALLDNLWARYVEGTDHVSPFYYYLYQLPIDFLPWSLLAPALVTAGRRVLAEGADPGQARVWRFLLAWIGSALVFFSFSEGKRGLYLVPVYPAAALLCADAVVTPLLAGARPIRAVRAVLAGLAALLAIAGLLVPLLAPRFGIEPPALFPWLWLALALAAGFAYRRAGPSWLRRGAVVVAAAALAELIVFTVFFPALDPEKSPRPVAEAAAALTRDGERIGVTRGTLVGGLVYYGGRPVDRLESPGAIASFLAAGGRVMVTEERNLPLLEAATPVEIRFRVRSGKRALVVVTPAAAPASAP